MFVAASRRTLVQGARFGAGGDAEPEHRESD